MITRDDMPEREGRSISAMLPQEVIRKKRDGNEIDSQNLKQFLFSYNEGKIPDYQMSAFLMAGLLKGFTNSETDCLTDCIVSSGQRVNFALSGHWGEPVDKHSTGGVGDKTSLIIGPIAAAAGVPVPMISGRGLGHTGGTLDKLESVPGFRTDLNLKQFRDQVSQLGLCFIGQTKEICPLDKKLYALRDVTATVESISLIAASIISKKSAEGISALVLDVKFGAGAFMKDLLSGRALAKELLRVGEARGLRMSVALTDMASPLGSSVGNWIEVLECEEILSGTSLSDTDPARETLELSLDLAAAMIWLGRKSENWSAGRHLAQEMITSGKALRKWREVVRAQGGSESPFSEGFAAWEGKLREGVVVAPQSGWIQSINAEEIGFSSIILGAGRLKVEDSVDLSAGVEFFKKVGEQVHKGDPLARYFNSSGQGFPEASSRISNSFVISPSPVSRISNRVVEILGEPWH